jgi:tetratricopeptide (TPR) repeat protein
MFREDYVLRMIEQATAVVTAILGLTRLERYPEALAEVDRSLQRFLGLNQSLVTALSASELVAMIRWGDRLDIGKLVVLAELLQAEGDIYAAQQQPPEAQARYLKAVELLLEVAFEAEHNLAAVQPRLAALRQRLDVAAMPPDLAEWLAHYESTLAALPAGPAAE